MPLILNLSSQPSLNLAVLVVSCDSYCDMWQPFFMLFKRFWPDCPYKVYLLSNHHSINEEGIIPVLVGEDHSWSDNLIKALDAIEEEYILMLIDDLFFTNYVQQESIQEVFAWIIRMKPNYVRFYPKPKPDKTYNNQVGIVSPGTLYRTATVISVWKKIVLLDLLKPGENAWDFEVYGAIRSDKYEGFYSTWKVLIPVVNGVIKRKWQRSAIKRLESLGVPLQLNKRKIMTLYETIVFFVVVMRNWVLQRFPSHYQRRIKNLFTLRQCKRSLKNKFY